MQLKYYLRSTSYLSIYLLQNWPTSLNGNRRKEIQHRYCSFVEAFLVLLTHLRFERRDWNVLLLFLVNDIYLGRHPEVAAI